MFGHLKIGVLTAALLLSGCALLPKVTTPINQAEVYAALNAYGIAQSAAITYLAFPFCAAGEHASATHLCKETAIILKVKHADALARATRDPLEAFVRNPANYPNLSYGALLGAFRAALSNLQAVEAQSNIKIGT